MIRNRDPRLKDPEFAIYSDSDFEDSPRHSEKPADPLLYKDLVAKHLLHTQIETKADSQVVKQEELRASFLSAVDEWKGSAQGELLSLRAKSPERELRSISNEGAYLEEFFRAKLWEKPSERLLTYNEIVDQEDLNREEEIESFETAYNFRYEQEGFDRLRNYPRNLTGSVRTKNETRKKAREDKLDRKTTQKTQLTEELKRLKNRTKHTPLGQEHSEDAQQHQWWLCDGCNTGIPETHYRFDCKECKNFTLCESCRGTVEHPHRLKKVKVPPGCQPPSEVLYIHCDQCSADITRSLRLDCPKCEDFSVCEPCGATVQHEHPLKSTQEILEEHYSLDYEELLGDVKCRFNYRAVKPEAYGFNDEELIQWDDKALNSVVGIKKLATYKAQEPSAGSLKKKKKWVEKQVKLTRKKHKNAETSRLQSYGISK